MKEGLKIEPGMIIQYIAEYPVTQRQGERLRRGIEKAARSALSISEADNLPVGIIICSGGKLEIVKQALDEIQPNQS